MLDDNVHDSTGIWDVKDVSVMSKGEVSVQ